MQRQGTVPDGSNPDAQRSPDTGDLADIATDFGGIHVNATDYFEAGAVRDLPHDGRPDRAEAEVEDADGSFP